MTSDVIVIGGSFAGLSAALQLGRARRTVAIIDAGQPRNRFAAASHGFFGQDGAAPREMIARAREQVLAYPTVTFIDGEAVAARQDGPGQFAIDLASPGALESRSGRRILLAHGVQDVLPNVPGLAERWGVSVLVCPYCHGYEYAERQLGVLSTGPLSVHQVQLIAEWGPTTFFLNGTAEIDDESRAELQRRKITIEPAPIEQLEGEGTALAGVRLTDGRLIEIEALFAGPSTRLTPLAEQLGCGLEDGPAGPFIRTDEMKQTTIPGVFAAGDAATAMWNASIAAAAGTFAGVSIHRSLVFPSAELP